MPLLNPDSQLAASLREFSRVNSANGNTYWMPLGFWIIAQDPEEELWKQKIDEGLTGWSNGALPLHSSLKKMVRLSMLEVVNTPYYDPRVFYRYNDAPGWKSIREAADRFVAETDGRYAVH
jgi:hypothetical protein